MPRRRRKSNCLFSLSVTVLASITEAVAEEGRPLVADIHPMIGAGTDDKRWPGKTFPGADTPFGLVQLSPGTIRRY